MYFIELFSLIKCWFSNVVAFINENRIHFQVLIMGFSNFFNDMCLIRRSFSKSSGFHMMK
jgi:hypothetical protein